MKKVAHFQQPTPFVTAQDVVHVVILIALSLLLLLVPIRGFGQTMPEPPATGGFPSLDAELGFESPTVPPVNSEPAPTADVPQVPATLPLTPQTQNIPDPAAQIPVIDQFQSADPQGIAPQNTALQTPLPRESATKPATASQYQPIQTAPLRQPIPRNPQQELTVSSEHPFRQYWGMPNDPQTQITGKPMTVAELFNGTRSTAVRCQLLQAYWELSGLLAVYHFRGETERLASGAAGAQQADMMTLLREQHRAAEAEFIKQQWVLAELLKQYKGRTLQELELPIPADFPLYPRYQTHADKIARTERTQYLGRMIPIQEQLIETKNGLWKAASEMMPNASQPFFVISDQRTTAFLELTSAMVEYNKMIAEYALETIPPNVSHQQLVGAVIRLPVKTPRVTAPEQPPSSQRTSEGITLTGYEAPVVRTAQSF